MRLRKLHKRRALMYGVTTACALSSASLLFLVNSYLRVALPFPAPTMAILAAIICFIFPGLVERSYSRWVQRIDDNISNMLSDVAGGVRSG